MEKEILQLEERVDELLKWKNYRIQERLRFPVNVQTQKILDADRYSLKTIGKLSTLPVPINNLLETPLIAFGLTIYINDERRVVEICLPLNRATANAGTDAITNTSGQHNLNNGDIIGLTANSTMPGGLDKVTSYYVVNRTATTFQVSLTSSGSPINITSSEASYLFWAKLN